MLVTKKLKFLLVGFAMIAAASAGAVVLTQTFGSSGYDGQSGRGGLDGRSGEDNEIVADGSSASYEMQGDDGSDASDGFDGRDASSCTHGTPAYNLEGASGGDGGIGGTGGDGGNGGALTVYFNDIANLKKIFVDASPGYGGEGGRGGRQGEGCRCQRNSWQVDVNGTMTTFYCNDGPRGQQGYQGSRGSDGSYGKVLLIGQLEPLENDVDEIRVPFTDLLNEQFVFGKNYWLQAQGSRALFATGSKLANSYLKFDKRRVVKYGFKWNVTRPIEDFTGINAVVWIDGNFKPSWDHSDGIWHSGTDVTNEDGSIDHVITGAVKSREALDFNYGLISGTGTSFAIDVDDKSGATTSFEHSILLNYYTKSNGTYYRRYAKTLTPELYEIQDGKIVIKAGLIPIDAKYFAPGVYTYIVVQISRAMGNHNGSKVIEKYHQIPVR